MLERAKAEKTVKGEKRIPMSVQSAKFIQKEKSTAVVITADGKEMTMEELQKKSKAGQIGKGGKALK
jgi:hypothetical protein